MLKRITILKPNKYFLLYRSQSIVINSFSTKIRTTKRVKIRDDNDFNFTSVNKKIGSNVNNKTKGKLNEPKIIDTNSLTVNELQFDWFKKLNEKNDPKTFNLRIEKILKKFLSFTDIYKIKNLHSNLDSILKPSLEKFGEIMLKDSIMKDETLKEIYQKGSPIIAYAFAVQHLMKDSEDIEVIEEREIAPRFDKKVDKAITKDFENILKNIEYFQHTNKLIDNFSDIDIKIEDKEDVEIKLLKKLIEDNFYKLPTPRMLHLNVNNSESFLNIIANYIELIDIHKITNIYQDLIICQMRLTRSDLDGWLTITLKNCNEFKEENYNQLKKGINQMGYKVSVDEYNLFLSTSLETENLKLFEQISNDFSNDGYVPDRNFLMNLESYAYHKKDFNIWLNIMEMRIDKYSFQLFPQDYESIFQSLIGLGYKSLAEDFLNILLLIRNGYKEVNKEKLREAECDEQGNAFNLENGDSKSNKSELFDNPIEMFDLVSDRQQLISIYPKLSTEMLNIFLLTSSSFEEFQKYGKLFLDNDVKKDTETFKIELAFFDKYKSEKNLNLDFETFQLIIVNLVESLTTEEESVRLLTDETFLEIFIKITENFIDEGELDGNDDEIVQSVKVLLLYTEDLQHKVTDATERAQVLASILKLSSIEL